MPTQAEIEKVVKRVLKQTDWKHYEQMVSWGVQRPNCGFYDGKDYVCGYWQNWLEIGRRLYHQGEEGDQQFLEKLLKETVVIIGNEHFPQTIRELEARCRYLGIIGRKLSSSDNRDII